MWRLATMQELIYPDFRVRRPGFLTDAYARTWDVSADADQLGSSTCCTSIQEHTPLAVCRGTQLRLQAHQ
jgi:hypothetical protein